MPLLDVTDLTFDADIAGEGFTVIRRIETVTSSGVVTTSRQIFAARGSISPSGDNSLAREDAFQTQAKSIKVITMFLLRGQGKDELGRKFQPDLVQWKGNSYIVSSINDYSQFGGGFIEAECSSIDYNDQAPI